MTTETEDPLEGADVGETRHVSESKHFHGINYEPDSLWGSDRVGDISITEIEIVENDEGNDDFVVTWEADLTKRLPRRWDECREPRTAEEETQARRSKWLRRAGRFAALAIPMGIATALTYEVMGAAATSINGVEVGQPPIGGMVMLFAVMLFIAFALPYLPGKVNGGVRR